MYMKSYIPNMGVYLFHLFDKIKYFCGENLSSEEFWREF